jgi:tryptophanyl-tRNA synthetase
VKILKDKDTKKDLSKEDKINAEIKKLNAIFTKLESKTKKAVHSLIENAAFMSVTLSELQEKINIEGVTEQYKNGENQYGVKKSATVEVYNQMVKNHMGIMKQLTDLLPKVVSEKDKDDGFDDFVNGRDET